MGNYSIQEMNEKMLPNLQVLFENIYPSDSCIVRKLLYKNDHPGHVVTLVAKEQDEIIGQVNIFEKDIIGGILNIGCHVSENSRKKGIGTKLVQKAIKVANDKGYSEFHILTEPENVAACRLAEKLSFVKSKGKYSDKHLIYYKKTG